MLTRTQYGRLIYTLPSCYSSIRLSTLVLAPPGLDVARLTGLVALGDDCVLCVYELLNFGQGIIEAYRYEVSRCRPPFIESLMLTRTQYEMTPLWPPHILITSMCRRVPRLAQCSASNAIASRPLD
jgi:hypothetical protein